MAVLTNSSRDDADHATDRLPAARVEAEERMSGLGWTAADVTESRASLRAHLAAGGRVSEWLQNRATVSP